MNVAALRVIRAFVCVRAKIIALGLRQVLRQSRCAIAVKIREARRYCRHGNA